MPLPLEFGLVLLNGDFLSTAPLSIHVSGDISRGGNFCFRVFKNQLMVINKYACIYSRREPVKFIKVTWTKIKQANKRIFYITDINANKNQMIIKKAALTYKEKWFSILV